MLFRNLKQITHSALMKKYSTILLVSLAFNLGAINSVFADTYAPSHPCSKPTKPVKSFNDWEIKKFNNDAKEFRACIQKFVEEQKSAIAVHKNAAEMAIDEWKNFVKAEFNTLK